MRELIILMFICLSLSCTSKMPLPDDDELADMEVITDVVPMGSSPSGGEEDLHIKIYYRFFFGNITNSDNTIRIEIDRSNCSYSISSPHANKVICSNVYYVKTFGGAPPIVKVYLINNRFVAYPETLRDSRVEPSGKMKVSQMKAVTHVYDLQDGDTFTSDSYSYDHDVPLYLPISELLMAIEFNRRQHKFDFFTITLSEDSAGQEEYVIYGRKWTHNDLEDLLAKRSKSEKESTVFIYTESKNGKINTNRVFNFLELLKNAGWEGIAIFELNQKDGDKSKNMQVTVSLKDLNIDIRDPIISCPGDFFTSQTSPADYAADFITKMPPGFEIVKVPTPDAGGYPQEIRHKATGIEMVYVAPGEFMMGSPHSEEGRGDMESPHKVKLTRGYYIGKYEVTQSQWEKVMGNNPSKSSVANQPFVEVSWDDCKLFCNKLGGWFRLPTEAEWEYAARGGNKSKGFIYSGSNNLDEVGWYSQNSGDKPHEVGQKKPNELGIFDMSGNVFEWCFDWYANYPFGDITDPSGPSSAELSRVSRGGCWSFVAKNCRSATRIPGFKSELCGFRVMLEIPLVGEAGHSPAND